MKIYFKKYVIFTVQKAKETNLLKDGSLFKMKKWVGPTYVAKKVTNNLKNGIVQTSGGYFVAYYLRRLSCRPSERSFWVAFHSFQPLATLSNSGYAP